MLYWIGLNVELFEEVFMWILQADISSRSKETVEGEVPELPIITTSVADPEPSSQQVVQGLLDNILDSVVAGEYKELRP